MKKFIIVIGLLFATNTWANDNDVQIAQKINKIYELVYPSGNNLILNSYTMNRVEAFRLWKSLPIAQQQNIAYLFESPSEYLDCIYSSKRPIKVCYNKAEQLEKSRFVLEIVEDAWEKEVVELGFYPPKVIDEDGSVKVGMDFYFESTSAMGAGGYTAPTGYDENTVYADSTSYIVIDEGTEEEDWLKTIIYHEFNHSCQMAMDVNETGTSMEATATWIEPNIIPLSDSYFLSSIMTFQASPDKSLGYFESSNSYQYGAALFVQFIQEYLGEDDPLSIVQIWKDTIQSGYENEPDFLDVIVAMGEGQDKDLNTIISQFGEWRFYIGQNDDNKHFKNGNRWYGAEVYIDGNFSYNVNHAPIIEKISLQELGYYYAEIGLSGQFPDGKLLIKGSGSSKSNWNMEAWLLNNKEIIKKVTATSESGEIFIDSSDIAPADMIIFEVMNTGKNVDWDQNWSEKDFEYSIDFLKMPSIASVSPNELLIGEKGTITITGENFSDESTAEISGEDITISSVETDETTITLNVEVGMNAELGFRDIKVKNYTNYEGYESVLEKGIELLKPGAPSITSISPQNGYPGDNLLIRVNGKNLTSDIEASFSCNSINISKIQFVNETTIYLSVDIAQDALAESCDLTVTDNYEQSYKAEDAFNIITEEIEDDESSGCSISNSDKNSINIIYLFFIFSIFIIIRQKNLKNI